MLALRGCLQVGRRLFYSKCSRCSPLRDPAYLGLFEPQQRESPSSEDQGDVVDGDLVKRNDLRVAFCYKIRDWARTTPPEYISRPPLRPRSRRRKESATHKRKVVAGEDAHNYAANDDEDEESEDFEDVDDGELDVVDDEDELNELDDEGEDSVVDKDDFAARHGSKVVDGPLGEDADENRTLATDKVPDTVVGDTTHKNVLLFDPPTDGYCDADEKLYYYTEKGKLKFKPIHIIAPKDEIYKRLSQSGLISSKIKRPLPVLKLVKKTDAEIVGWYFYCSIELLQFFRICHNLKEVKAIVEYHIRWSAIRTLARKYKCNAREIVKKYGRDLECEDKKGKKVRLMTRQEIKEVVRGVNKRVEMIHRFLALNILDEMD